MGNVDIDDYVARKNGGKAKPQLHPAMESILKDTHGVIIYQEQVMKIANLVAGFSLSEADKLRRVMAKKKPELMAPTRRKFLESADKQGVSHKTADAVFDLIEPFAGYGFNKSHAAGYAVLSYLTAYLKANYPLEFMTATLTSEIGSSDKLRKFVAEVRRMGLPLLGPDVNRSEYRFSIEAGGTTDGHGWTPTAAANDRSESGAPRAETDDEPRTTSDQRALRFGLGGIKNLGQGVCEGIVKERQDRPYLDFADFVRRTRSFTNRKAQESLIMAGALDRLNPDRKALLEILPDELQRAASRRAALESMQGSLFGDLLSETPESSAAPELARNGDAAPVPGGIPQASVPARDAHHAFEKSALGFYLSSHPLEEFRLEIDALKCNSLESVGERDSEATVAVAGIITGRKFKQDKRGLDYAIIQLEDLTGTGEVMVFNKVLEGCRNLVKPDEMVIVLGKVRTRGEGQSSVWADTLYSLREAREFLKRVTIRFTAADIEENQLMAIRRVLEQHQGSADVFFQIPEDGREKLVKVRDLKVSPSTRLVQEVSALALVRGASLAGSLPRR